MLESTPADECRQCRTCREVKPVSEFSRRSTGYRWDCKPCVASARTEVPVDNGQRKICSKCNEAKPLSQFGSRGKDRIRGDCKSCVAEVSRGRYRASPETRAKHKALRDTWRADNPNYMQGYYLDNREEIIAAAIQYAKENPPDPEQVRRWARERYAANPERHRAKDKEWRENNLERAREVGRRAQSRRRAQLRGLPFEFYTLDQILARDGMLCVLCDEELDLAAEHPDLLAATVEHLECVSWPNSAGDVFSNVAVAHFTCNSSRGDRPHPAAARKRAELLATEREALT